MSEPIHALVPLVPLQAVRATTSGMGVPALITAVGEHATRRFLECFAATIRNKNARMAYYRAVPQFFAVGGCGVSRLLMLS